LRFGLDFFAWNDVVKNLLPRLLPLKNSAKVFAEGETLPFCLWQMRPCLLQGARQISGARLCLSFASAKVTNPVIPTKNPPQALAVWGGFFLQ